jgi:predicted HicB family RNase H-like nuclease
MKFFYRTSEPLNSGKLTLRIPPSVHAAIATAAETKGKILNTWIADILDKATDAR